MTLSDDSNSVPSSRSVIYSQPSLTVNVYKNFGLKISRMLWGLKGA